MQEYLKLLKHAESDGKRKLVKEKKPTPVAAKQVSVTVALHMIMGVLHQASVRMYWVHRINIRIFFSMLRDCFFFIQNNLHFVDKTSILANITDKFFTIQPIFNSV